jgi:hypothetical protein
MLKADALGDAGRLEQAAATYCLLVEHGSEKKEPAARRAVTRTAASPTSSQARAMSGSSYDAKSPSDHSSRGLSGLRALPYNLRTFYPRAHLRGAFQRARRDSNP